MGSALVFGGGHVVLPLLQAEVVQPGWVGPDAFLAGYGAAQAVPGPLFTFGAYLGAVMEPQPNGIVGAVIGLLAVFLPGLLFVVGTLPFWDAFRTRPTAQAAILSPHDFALALLGFVLLTMWKAPPWAVVIILALGGAGLAMLR